MKNLLTLILTLILTVVTLSAESNSIVGWKNITVDNRKITVYTLFMDHNGVLWVGTNGGLFGYDGVSFWPISNDINTHGWQIYSIAEHADTLYLGTNNGLKKYSPLTGSEPIGVDGSLSEIRSIKYIDGEIWMGSLYGVSRYNTASGISRQCDDGLPHRSVYALLRDSRGVLYAGTYNGLARWNEITKRFDEVKALRLASKHDNIFVNTICENPADGTLAIGTEGGLFIYNPVNEHVKAISQFHGMVVKSISPTDDGELVVGTDHGVGRFEDGKLEMYCHDTRQPLSISDNEIWCVFLDRRKNLWVGHEMGMSMSTAMDVVRPISIANLTGIGEGMLPYAMYRDKKHRLWIGGSNGLIKINGNLATDSCHFMAWYRPGTSNSLSHKTVRDITEDKSGDIWVATDGGLNRYNSGSNTFKNFIVSDTSGHFKANWVYSVLPDGDNIITGSYLGGVHITRRNLFDTAGSHRIIADAVINSDNGLPNDFVNTLVADSKGTKWLLMYRDSTLIRISDMGKRINHIDILSLTGYYPTHIAIDRNDRLWCGLSNGVAVFDTDGSFIKYYSIGGNSTLPRVLCMGAVNDDMWLATQENVWCMNTSMDRAEPLPLPRSYYMNIFHDTQSGKVYLGAVDEIIVVDPVKLKSLNIKKGVRMLRIREQNRTILLDESNLTNPVILQMPYQSAMNIEVSSLDYGSLSTPKYAYRIMTDKHDTGAEWVIIPEGSNVIPISNLYAGKHRVEVKMFGSESSAAVIDLSVSPPWYLSWVAIAVYVILLLSVIGLVAIYLRRRANNRIRDAERRRQLADAERRINFLADISHDLKTPLSMIIGPLSRIREKNTDKQLGVSLDMMYSNALRLNNLIHRTVEMNRLDEGAENMLIISKIEAVEFCTSVFDSYRDGHPEKNFVFHKYQGKLYVDADAIKLESVLNNLLSNACKYSASDATVCCRVDRRDNMLEITVSDDGIGIPRGEQSLVFQRMFRSKVSANNYEGTGIGLYLIKKYMELHHGNIELYSSENEGTTFIITLPLAESGNEEASEHAIDEDDKRAKILLVEDNVQIAAFLQDMLGEDYNCTTAGNGRAGLAVASTFRPDLIIVDEMMPVMSGMEMCAALKRNPHLALIPIIMLTAKTDNVTESESVRHGIDVFMSKPFEPQLLKERVKMLIERNQHIKNAARIEAIATPHDVVTEDSVMERQLAGITKIIEDNMSDPDLNVNSLSDKSGIAPKQLYRLIKKLVGITPVDFIRRMRLQKGAMLLEQRKFTISEVGYMVGFKSPSYFTKCFVAQFGVKPSEYADRKSDEKAEK